MIAESLAGIEVENAAETVLSIRDLRVAFRRRDGSETTAVGGLSMDVPRNGAMAVVGESGSGKTVSMRAMLGLLPESARTTGQALLTTRDSMAKDLLAISAPELRAVRGRQVGMVFQNAMQALNPTRTLEVQLTEHLRWHRLCGRAEAKERAIAALDRVGIPDPAKRVKMYPFQLSGGQRQRAMIAMAIVAEPELLIADEPTTALDVTVQRQVLDVLADLRRDGLSLVMSTHDLGVARYVCDDVVVMRNGLMVAAAPIRKFIDAAEQPYSRQLLAAALDIDPGLAARPAALRQAQGTGTAQGAKELVRARDLVKIFHGRGGDVLAVSEVSLDIAAGETVGVVGESGSGKSTLARLITRLVDPSAGSLSFGPSTGSGGGRTGSGSIDLLAASGLELKSVRRRVQMVFQNPYGSLLPHLTVAANVTEPLRVHKVGTPAEQRARAVELLELVGIPPNRMDHYPRQFSGGQQQRIAIARALALKPELLVCDEPTSALDVSIQAQVLDLLQDLQERLGPAMLFITHNLAVAQRLCDRIIVMAAGQAVEAGPNAAIFGSPAHPYTRALLAAVLPVHGDPLPWDASAEAIDLGGDLREVSAGHWVRQRPVPAPDDLTTEALSTAASTTTAEGK